MTMPKLRGIWRLANESTHGSMAAENTSATKTSTTTSRMRKKNPRMASTPKTLKIERYGRVGSSFVDDPIEALKRLHYAPKAPLALALSYTLLSNSVFLGPKLI